MKTPLRSLVEDRGIIQSWLAVKLGMSAPGLVQILNGRARLRVTALRPLAVILGVPIETVLTAAEQTLSQTKELKNGTSTGQQERREESGGDEAGERRGTGVGAGGTP